jgi:hypothetical protein
VCEPLLVRSTRVGLAIAGAVFYPRKNVGILRMASLASVETADVVPVQRPTYRVENLYYEPALVDAILERWSAIPDLPLEDATEEEENKVDELRRLVLKAKGLEEPPKDWHNHHYVRGQMLCYLRARGGDLDAATERALQCIDYMDHVLECTKAYYKSPQAYRDLWDTKHPHGFFGKDKRGCSVMYVKYGPSDIGGMVQHTSLEFFQQQDWRNAMFYWDTMFQESINAGVFFQGRIWVIDAAQSSWSRIQRGKWVGKAQSEYFPNKEHPMPEGVKFIFVMNVPWIVEKGYQWLKGLIPKRTQKKIFLFKANDPAFMETLSKHVDKDQIPVDFGGTSPEPWPYGDGGDMRETEVDDSVVVLQVPKLETVDIPVVPGTHCIVECRVKNQDIDVSVALVRDESKDEVPLYETVRIQEKHGWQVFEHESSGSDASPVLLRITFDNSYSWFRSKTVEYKVVVLNAN